MGKRRNKYNARRVTLYGITFDSQAEADRYFVLREMQERGEIAELTVHPRFVLQGAFNDWKGRRIRAIHYEADFQYFQDDQLVLEDVKGVETPVFRLKRKMLLYHFPHIVFRMIKKGRVIE